MCTWHAEPATMELAVQAAVNQLEVLVATGEEADTVVVIDHG